MTIKSLLIGAAGALAFTGAAQAADLPAPEPVDYVRICDAYGSGYYYIPGTETCLRVFGAIRTDYRYFGDGEVFGVHDGHWRFRARAYVRMDSRTSTEYGLLRTYVDLWFTNDEDDHYNSNDQWFHIYRAFIQFGGLTAGRTASFFDPGVGTTLWAVTGPATSDTEMNVLAYTASFGNGMSASLSLESGANRRAGWSPTHSAYAEFPDLVANIRVDQGWGSAMIAAIIHDAVVDTGWGINATVSGRLPTGTTAFLSGAWADGVVSAVIPYWQYGNVVGAPLRDFLGGGTVEGWSIYGGLRHEFTPMVSAGIAASYASLEWNNAAGFAREYNRLDVQGVVTWAPVSGLKISAEVDYRDEERKAFRTRSASGWVGVFRLQRDF
jgi:hypothetical protein